MRNGFFMAFFRLYCATFIVFHTFISEFHFSKHHPGFIELLYSIRHLRLNYDVNSRVTFLSRHNKIGWRHVPLTLDSKKSTKRTSKDLYYIFSLETYGYHGACYHWIQLLVMAWIAPLGFSDLALHGQIRVNGYLRRRLRHRSDLHIST